MNSRNVVFAILALLCFFIDVSYETIIFGYLLRILGIIFVVLALTETYKKPIQPKQVTKNEIEQNFDNNITKL